MQIYLEKSYLPSLIRLDNKNFQFPHDNDLN